MANVPPPDDYNGVPVSWTLSSGTRLSRVYSSEWSVSEFNPTLADPWGGGRFDATAEDKYAYIYAGADDRVAVSESLLRDLNLGAGGARLLPRKALKGRRLGWLTTNTPLQLVSLRSGQDLAAVAQDTWLTQASSKDYTYTRRWGHAIRKWAPWASGFVWFSHREPDALAFILFEDRCPAGSIDELTDGTPVPVTDNQLDIGAGHNYLLEVLETYRVTVDP